MHSPATSFYIALLIFIAAFSGAVMAFTAMQKRDQERAFMSGAVTEGEHFYLGMGPNGCAAIFALSLKQDADNSAFEAGGILNAVYRGNKIPMRMRLAAYFNALGQLIGSYLKITFLGNRITLGTLNVNPIRIILRASIDGQVYRYQASFPGPVELVPAGTGFFRMKYPFALGPLPNGQTLRAQPFLNAADFKLVPADDLTIASCFAGNERILRGFRRSFLRGSIGIGPGGDRAQKALRDLDLTSSLDLLEQSLSWLTSVLSSNSATRGKTP